MSYDPWKDYFKYLENLRQSGIVNMFGAVPYLRDEFPELSYDEAKSVLVYWMEHYGEIIKDVIDEV